MKNRERVRAELKRLGNRSFVSTDKEVSPSFNKWVKKNFPTIYEKAIKVRSELIKTKRGYRNYNEEKYVYFHWIHHPELPATDPYLGRPTQSQLLADISTMLIFKEDEN